MIELKVSDFPAPYSSINGKKSLNVSIYDIARAGMTIGYSKLSDAIASLGLFRFLELYFRTRTYLEKSNGNYQLKPIFQNLDSSEQKAISYFFGQALTKLFAEKYLYCDIVDNFNNYKGKVTFSFNGKKFVPKKQLHNTKKNPKEPDLVGLANNEYHILEAKGYSSGFKKGEFQHAINQVSIIDKVNGRVPVTKTACFFDLSGNPIVGTIQDPINDSSNMNIQFDRQKFINNYYNIFNLKVLQRRGFWTVQLNNKTYAGFRLFTAMYPYYFFGVDMDIFNQVNSNQPVEYPKRDNYIAENSYKDYQSEVNYSIGPDGILFLRSSRRKGVSFENKYWD